MSRHLTQVGCPLFKQDSELPAVWLVGSHNLFDPLAKRFGADALPLPDPFAAPQRIPGIEEKGGSVQNQFDRAYYETNMARNRRLAEEAQIPHIREAHLRLAEFYAVALQAIEAVAETDLQKARA
ncbi:hypothetical protein KRZ98_18350 [Sphingobium sp. AS12]|uniref:hypothetical protein n=1 Tax=Sphingobium sp. AS12 TaxID=2849495 RepID=UPI001C315DE7|nr:hypothetical protein [Sphingobium sp. AS12]MBV2150200.1 hypothetical protein [Sphingobium sp. AS12]